MSKGLRSWVQANWVDIANPKKGGGFPKCGRSGGEKRKLKEKLDKVRNLTTQELN